MKIEDFCKRRKIDKIGIQTPLLVPSFSSKGFDHINLYFNELNKFIPGIKLISAYDISNNHIDHRCIYESDLVMIDSGGYETCNNFDLSEPYKFKQKNSDQWNINKYQNVINNLESYSDPILVSYDYYSSIENQIITASNFYKKNSFCSDFLVKPNSIHDQTIDIEDFIKNIEKIKSFDIIGFTEKELGKNYNERIENLLMVRNALNTKNIKIPIHIFGCLDPISVWLYYLCGADIFDGLSWLRYHFNKSGEATYINNSSLFINPNLNLFETVITNSYKNLITLKSLQRQMETYASEYSKNEINIDSSIFSDLCTLITMHGLGGLTHGQ